MRNSKFVIISSFITIAICFGVLFACCKTNDNDKFKAKATPNDAEFTHLNNNDISKNNKARFKNFPGLKMNKTDLKLFYEGKNLRLTLPIYIERNRYFLPLTEIVDRIDGSLNFKGEILTIKLNNKAIEINTRTNTFKTGTNTHKLRQRLIFLDNITYISMFDFVNLLNLKPLWQYNENSIMFFNNRENFIPSKITHSQRSALLRLEDISAGKTYRYADADSLYKLRIISDYLSSSGIPFHIAWVPRYIDHSKGTNIDNDLANKNSIYNADFLYTLDYFIERGGIVGLHGYTHQASKEISIDGTEFGNKKYKATLTDEYTIKRINSAKEAARLLNIPVDFFETPHYSALPNQLKIIEDNFDYIYEPYNPDKKNGNTYITVKHNGNRNIKYVPTPLDYLDGKKSLPDMFNKINGLKSDVMASFFFHPNIEFEDIKVTKEANGYPSYIYSEQSALHQIINTLLKKGYTFKNITELN